MSLLQELQDSLAKLHRESDSGAQLTPADKLVAAVSGGPDSLALLHALAQGGLHPPENLVVAHLNHGLRDSAAAEAEFVVETAYTWCLASQVEAVDVAGVARNEGLSIEAAGRQVRYRFLSKVARHSGARHVATGHNADDQAETVLMNLLRGAGYAGLRGMLPVTSLPGDPDITLLRPLLSVERARIEAYCRQHDLKPIFDATNEEVTFFRNRVRNELLPLLAEYSPQIKQRLQHTATLIAADFELIVEMAEEAWSAALIEEGPGWLLLDRPVWRNLSIALRRHTLRQAVSRLRSGVSEVGFLAIEQARRVADELDVGAQAALPGALTLSIGYRYLKLSAAGAIGPLSNLPQLPSNNPLSLPVPGRVSLDQRFTIETSFVSDFGLDAATGNRDPWLAFADAAKLGQQSLLIRPRMPGERFRPLGMGGQSARVSDVMINRKVPAALRARWPIVASESHLVWLVGHHLDERVRVTPQSQLVVRLILDRTLPGNRQ